MLKVYRVCFQVDKKEKDIEKCVKDMIEEGIKIYKRKFIKPVTRLQRSLAPKIRWIL